MNQVIESVGISTLINLFILVWLIPTLVLKIGALVMYDYNSESEEEVEDLVPSGQDDVIQMRKEILSKVVHGL